MRIRFNGHDNTEDGFPPQFCMVLAVFTQVTIFGLLIMGIVFSVGWLLGITD